VIGNEIPASIVRWRGARAIERFLKRLHAAVKSVDHASLVRCPSRIPGSRRLLAEPTMGPLGVVFDAPRLDGLPRFLHCGEPMQIEALVSEPAVECFDHRVGGGFAGATKTRATPRR
jgi:hypothetical protein